MRYLFVLISIVSCAKTYGAIAQQEKFKLQVGIAKSILLHSKNFGEFLDTTSLYLKKNEFQFNEKYLKNFRIQKDTKLPPVSTKGNVILINGNQLEIVSNEKMKLNGQVFTVKNISYFDIFNLGKNERHFGGIFSYFMEEVHASPALQGSTLVIVATAIRIIYDLPETYSSPQPQKTPKILKSHQQ